jgi:DNA-binding NtrC family response regulator
VTQPPGAPTILIADEDMGFLWWLGELFNELGYRSLPALSCEQALSLLNQSPRRVDLLLINPRLKGASGLVETLRRARPLKVVLIQGPEEYQIQDIQAVASIEPPSGWAPVSRQEWRQKLLLLLTQIGIRAAS